MSLQRPTCSGLATGWPAERRLSGAVAGSVQNTSRHSGVSMPPNFLILMADQLTAARAARLRRPVARRRTSMRSRRRRRGVRLLLLQQPAVRAVAILLPGRAAALDASAPTTTRRNFPRRCRPSPTTCAAPATRPRSSGKMHFCGPDQLHGFEERLTTDIYPADFGWTPDWTRFEERAELVSHHGLGHPGRPLRAHQPDRLRRRGGLRGARRSCSTWRAARTHGRSAWSCR